eukprot:NODE_1426_length_864_cov_38.550882_g1380_i0.p1 GENE.NODE_1426_length_864_cov_38.550882_g1380_i0~~NODE_1426_length_864_cov_38.550882_g1380_i0.p1  ORF type:complete len:184 (+),score=10.03 NODE_1426_length_864_cov_38.550882_g1380_i0:94-645(+)
MRHLLLRQFRPAYFFPRTSLPARTPVKLWEPFICRGYGTKPPPPLPITEFNHVTRVCRDLEKSIDFHVQVLGFRLIERPDFETPGVWLHHDRAGFNIHLLDGDPPVRKTFPEIYRRDHINFLTSDIHAVEATLDAHNIPWSRLHRESIGVLQIFFSDPDGNVIEIGSCAPAVGEVVCDPKTQL